MRSKTLTVKEDVEDLLSAVLASVTTTWHTGTQSALSLPNSRSTTQRVNHSVSLLVTQIVSHLLNQPVNHSSNRSVNESITQCFNHSVCQSTSQSAARSACQSVSQLFSNLLSLRASYSVFLTSLSFNEATGSVNQYVNK